MVFTQVESGDYFPDPDPDSLEDRILSIFHFIEFCINTDFS